MGWGKEAQVGGQVVAEGAAAVVSAVSVAAAAASCRWARRAVSRSEAGIEAVRGWLDQSRPLHKETESWLFLP